MPNPSKTRRANISVVGSYRATSDEIALAFNLGRRLCDAGVNLICGGRAGVMSAVAEGFQSGACVDRGVVVGILPGCDDVDCNPYVDVPIPTGMGYLRNGLVANAGDAMVAIGGMAGTLSEVALGWQMGKPIAVLGASGWASRLGGTCLDERRQDHIAQFNTCDEVINWITTTIAEIRRRR